MGSKNELAAMYAALRYERTQAVLLSDAVAQRLGINATDLVCGELILRVGTLTPGDLRTATGLSSAAVTTVIDRLERAGFVERAASRDDKRRVLIRLRPESLKAVYDAYAPLEASLRRLLEAYEPAEFRLILDFLADYERVMSEFMLELRLRRDAERLRRTRQPAAKRARPARTSRGK
jgi:DNA-binding MarR family transcriptional regulator